MTEKELKNRKKQLLSSIKKDIKSLDKYIKTCENDEIKKKYIVKTKILLTKIRAITPYIIPIILSSCISIFILDDIPFVINDVKRKEHIKRELDSLNNLSIEHQFEKFDNEQNTITSYTAWSYNNEMYNRSITIYTVDNLPLEEIEKIMKNNEIQLLDIIGNKKETRNKLPKEENKPYIKYTYYETSDKYYMIPETELHNKFMTLVWLIITMLGEFGALNWRANLSTFSYYNSIEEIYRKYLPNGSDINDMKELLNNKIENYKILVKKNEK